MKNNITGFALIEVLVALVILAIGLTGIYSGLSTNLKALIYLQNKTAANWVALNVLAKYQLHLLPNNEKTVGKEKMLDRVWYWQAVANKDVNLGMTMLDIQVKQSPNSKTFIHYTTYLITE